MYFSNSQFILFVSTAVADYLKVKNFFWKYNKENIELNASA